MEVGVERVGGESLAVGGRLGVSPEISRGGSGGRSSPGKVLQPGRRTTRTVGGVGAAEMTAMAIGEGEALVALRGERSTRRGAAPGGGARTTAACCRDRSRPSVAVEGDVVGIEIPGLRAAGELAAALAAAAELQGPTLVAVCGAGLVAHPQRHTTVVDQHRDVGVTQDAWPPRGRRGDGRCGSRSTRCPAGPAWLGSQSRPRTLASVSTSTLTTTPWRSPPGARSPWSAAWSSIVEANRSAISLALRRR